jgi:hypothetical protein
MFKIDESSLQKEMSQQDSDKRRGYNVTIWGVIVLIIASAIFPAIKPKDELAKVEVSKPAEPTNEQIVRWGNILSKTAIRNSMKNPEGVHFLEQTAEQYYPATGVYVTKWHVSGTNSFGAREQAYGVASVHYKGGDAYNDKNWELQNVKIIEDQE